MYSFNVSNRPDLSGFVNPPSITSMLHFIPLTIIPLTNLLGNEVKDDFFP
jgi:hypothetical protein